MPVTDLHPKSPLSKANPGPTPHGMLDKTSNSLHRRISPFPQERENTRQRHQRHLKKKMAKDNGQFKGTCCEQEKSGLHVERDLCDLKDHSVTEQYPCTPKRRATHLQKKVPVLDPCLFQVDSKREFLLEGGGAGRSIDKEACPRATCHPEPLSHQTTAEVK